jgi:hypothetical protein
MDSDTSDLKAFSIGTPHADTGVHEIRELITSGKSFAVLISISLIPQIARVASITDAHEHDDMESLSFSFSSLPKEQQGRANPESSLSLVSTYLAASGRAQALEASRRPVLVQTRASQGIVSSSVQATAPPTKTKASQRKQDTGVDKQRQSSLSSWIGKQLLWQIIPKKHLDKDGNLQMMENYPHGLLAIPSDGYSGQRILVPVDEQKALIKSTHAEIHHQGHTKVHHVLYPLYCWPGMDATIEVVCTACAKCIRATRRRRKLNLDFNPASQKELLLPRQRYGIDFYGVHNGEILVMVDLFSRETMLEFLPDRKMERVCQTIMKRIIFSRGVPNELRSDNAPELMQGIVRQVCQYLDIAQIVTGGRNPRGNAICERVNQTLGSMIRKLSDLDYKDLKKTLRDCNSK